MMVVVVVITICTSKTQRTGENREVQISLRRNRKVAEAEEIVGGASCDWGIRSCIRYV